MYISKPEGFNENCSARVLLGFRILYIKLFKLKETLDNIRYWETDVVPYYLFYLLLKAII